MLVTDPTNFHSMKISDGPGDDDEDIAIEIRDEEDQDHLATLHELSEIEEDDNDDDDEEDDYAYDYQNEDDRHAYDPNDDAHYYEDRSIDDDKKSLMECEEVVNAQFRNAELEQVIDREKQLRQGFILLLPTQLLIGW